MYSALNGVKQGGVASPTMFCLYIDELLLKLADSGVGCWFGKFYVGVLAYADDIVSLVPSASSMRTMLSYCYHFPSQYSLVFDANKSKCMLFLPRGKYIVHVSQFLLLMATPLSTLMNMFVLVM